MGGQVTGELFQQFLNFLILGAFLVLSIQPALAEETQPYPVAHPCRKAWNDKMQQYDQEYQAGLTNLLFQKNTNSSILQSEDLSRNLRTHNCKMFQICEVVQRSLSGEALKPGEDQVVGKPWRCQPTSVSNLGGLIAECSQKNPEVKLEQTTQELWGKCFEQAEKRVTDMETITQTETDRSNKAKKASNFIQYLMDFNQRLEKLSIDFSAMVGKLFGVTKKMTCVQRSCQ